MSTTARVVMGSLILGALVLGSLGSGCRVVASSPRRQPEVSARDDGTRGGFDPTTEVDPLIGTAAHGHTFPGPSWPFGMVQLGPDTRLTGWDGCSGYHYDDSVVHGFSHTHLSGTGIADYADVLIVPTVVGGAAPPSPDPEHPFAMRFDHADERAGPGWYSLLLREPAIEVELTTTPRVGLHRYRFADLQGGEAGLVLDLRHRDEVLEAWVEQVSPTELVGLRRSSSWARDQRVFFAARLSRPIESVASLGDATETRPDGRMRWEGRDVRLLLTPEPADEPLVLAVALSPVDVDGARANLRAEAPHDDFEIYRRLAVERWREALSVVEIEGGTPAQRRTFYTALYHSMLAPNLYEDVDGRTRGMDGAVHDTPDHTAYTVFSLWDTFRATHPLLTILEPERSADFVRTLLHQARTGGHLPMWELSANYTGTMIGYHAVSVIADAWAKGIRDFDASWALEAALESADADRLGLPGYRAQGYVPAEQEHESVSKTLEYAYDDWCIARLAEGQGREDLRDRFDRRAQSWANLFDPGSGLFRAREDGDWVPRFDPSRVDLHYTEANAWQYGFFVPHDVGGLVEAHGGPAELEGMLDRLFTTSSDLSGRHQVDITGLIGQYAHGNEPSHHVAYLYPYVGRAPKAQARVREIMDTLYGDAPDGLSGNDDCGQLSAWYVLSALGFYPLAPGLDEYVIGTPLFARATLHLPGGRDFVVEAPGVSSSAIYVRSAELDGRPRDEARLRHSEIVEGGRLVLRMDTEPNPGWGSIEPAPPLSAGRSPAMPAPRVVASARSFEERTEVSIEAPGEGPGEGEIRYTLDGSAPGPGSRLYDGPFELQATTTITAAVVDGPRSGPVVVATVYRRTPGVTATLSHPLNPSYEAGGAVGLIDGRRGTAKWRTGGWLGVQGRDFEATLELAEPRTVRQVSVGFLQDARSWIWMPRHLEVEVSSDGTRWRSLGRATHDVPDDDVERTYLRELVVRGRARRVRFVRIRAPTYGTIPSWHPGAGAPTFVFVDEARVE